LAEEAIFAWPDTNSRDSGFIDGFYIYKKPSLMMIFIPGRLS
jgi:hypothetical protein